VEPDGGHAFAQRDRSRRHHQLFAPTSRLEKFFGSFFQKRTAFFLR
jgi:hypothetical protein